MFDEDKTVVLGEDNPNFDFGRCPVCGMVMRPEPNDIGILRCAACRFIQKQSVTCEPGSIVGNKYKILSHMNDGGFGSIFICYPLEDVSVRYVLKVLRNASANNRLRFKREAKILSSVAGKRIPRIYDFWQQDNDFFIVMEYINGRNLVQLKKECVFDEQTVMLIAREVIIGLSDMWHEHSIIHRDIKPENIMLDENSKVRILDFGLSKQVGVNESTTMNITIAQTGLGTPGYMSPEQFSDCKNVDFRTDIFSLGATMFFLLCGQRPFDGDSPSEIFEDTLRNSPPPAERFAGKCSVPVMQIIQKMMQNDPSARHQSYSELLAEIDCLA